MACEQPDPDDTDPLEGADVGETRTVRESIEFHTTEFAPGAFYGSDRFGDVGVADVEVREDEYGDEVVVVTVGYRLEQR